MDGEVVLTTVSTIRPAASCEEEQAARAVLLNEIDHAHRRVRYFKRVLIYKADDSIHRRFSDVFDKLKSSLSQVLVYFHPFAGRVRVRDDCLLELICNDEGVQIVEASTEVDLNSIEDFQPSSFFSKLAQTPGCDPVWPWKAEYPLLFVQVTAFRSGGFSVGVTFSHQIADGTTIWHFLRSWAEIARGQNISEHPQFMYKSLIKGSQTPSRKEPLPLYPIVKSQEDTVFVLSSDHLQCKLFHVAKEMIHKLKNLTAQSVNARPFTTYEVICAHIWQRVTIARDIADEKPCKLVMAVNLRGKFAGLPQHYCGNGALYTAATATAAQLKQGRLASAAALIHQTIVRYTEEKVEALLELIAEYMGNKEMEVSVDWDSDADMLVRSSPRLRMYETDFGWGRPTAVAFDTYLNHNGSLLLDAGREEGSLDVTLALSPQAMQRLNEDIFFLPQ
ncbi:hypothetical protein O6H91_Y312500 [Diphasiastrum complanatum]|nr:hypothetical protein O6H91_Y312500 [Diphasiastrum complanatum]